MRQASRLLQVRQVSRAGQSVGITKLFVSLLHLRLYAHKAKLLQTALGRAPTQSYTILVQNRTQNEFRLRTQDNMSL